MASVLIPLANGVEEMEAVILIDVLRRAQWSVVAAGMDVKTVACSRGVQLIADVAWPDIDPTAFDVLLIPGGRGGVDALCADTRILDTVRSFVADGKLVGAICAGPLVLQQAGVLTGLTVTCHPGVRDELDATVHYTNERVLIDGGVATSQGPGTAFEFALELIRRLDGNKAADTVADGLIFP